MRWQVRRTDVPMCLVPLWIVAAVGTVFCHMTDSMQNSTTATISSSLRHEKERTSIAG